MSACDSALPNGQSTKIRTESVTFFSMAKHRFYWLDAGHPVCGTPTMAAFRS
jgi:hypothetical protein